MSIGQAFLRAIETQPQAYLTAPVKKALRRVRNDPVPVSALVPEHAVEQLGYRFNQLGRRWASVRLGKCVWVRSIDDLRAEWAVLRESIWGTVAEEDQAEVLFQLAVGAGLRGEQLDRRGRDFLFSLLASRPGDCAEVCCVDGVRWLSPLTVFFESINDLEAHSAKERKEFRDFLSKGAPLAEERAHVARMRRLCGLVAEWCYFRRASRGPSAVTSISGVRDGEQPRAYSGAI